MPGEVRIEDSDNGSDGLDEFTEMDGFEELADLDDLDDLDESLEPLPLGEDGPNTREAFEEDSEELLFTE